MITDASEFRKLVGVWGVTYLLDTNVVSNWAGEGRIRG